MAGLGHAHRSTKTVEFLARLMTHKAKWLAAQPNEFKTWNLLGGRKEPTPSNCSLILNTLIPWKVHTNQHNKYVQWILVKAMNFPTAYGSSPSSLTVHTAQGRGDHVHSIPRAFPSGTLTLRQCFTMFLPSLLLQDELSVQVATAMGRVWSSQWLRWAASLATQPPQEEAAETLRKSRGKTWQEPSVFLPHHVTGRLVFQPSEECQKALEFMDFPELCGSRPHYVYSGKSPPVVWELNRDTEFVCAGALDWGVW